jgi:hypothetical protein
MSSSFPCGNAAVNQGTRFGACYVDAGTCDIAGAINPLDGEHPLTDDPLVTLGRQVVIGKAQSAHDLIVDDLSAEVDEKLCGVRT